MKEKNTIEITSEIEQVLIGSLLGDGILQIQKKGINAYSSEIHSRKQKEYLLWKKELLGCLKPKIREYKTYDNRTNKYYYGVILWTKVHSTLTEFFKLLYINNKKSINKYILEKVGPLALAVWYCDDGSFGYINQNGKIATYLSHEDNVLIKNFLKERFNIDCSINKDGKSSYLYFSTKEIKKFLDIIRDYVPKCMNYKLGYLCKENISRLKEENLKRREKDKSRYTKNMKDPVKRALITKRKRKNQQRRLQDPDYRRKYNEYHKLK